MEPGLEGHVEIDWPGLVLPSTANRSADTNTDRLFTSDLGFHVNHIWQESVGLIVYTELS
jgi:hypothetical protein